MTSTTSTSSARTVLVVALLSLRFAIELVLFAAVAYLVSLLLDSTALRVVFAVVALAAVTAFWGVLLSPRRPVRLPLAARVVLELVLVGATSAGLVAAGRPGWATALVVAELVVLVWLWALGMPPGSDVGPPDRTADPGPTD
jgi:hypothetical protein